MLNIGDTNAKVKHALLSRSLHSNGGNKTFKGVVAKKGILVWDVTGMVNRAITILPLPETMVVLI